MPGATARSRRSPQCLVRSGWVLDFQQSIGKEVNVFGVGDVPPVLSNCPDQTVVGFEACLRCGLQAVSAREATKPVCSKRKVPGTGRSCLGLEALERGEAVGLRPVLFIQSPSPAYCIVAPDGFGASIARFLPWFGDLPALWRME